MEKTAHSLTDLEFFYHRQLANVYGVVEEAVGVDMMASKLLTKVIPRFEHFMHTNFGISEETHGGKNDPL